MTRARAIISLCLASCMLLIWLIVHDTNRPAVLPPPLTDKEMAACIRVRDSVSNYPYPIVTAEDGAYVDYGKCEGRPQGTLCGRTWCLRRTK